MSASLTSVPIWYRVPKPFTPHFLTKWLKIKRLAKFLQVAFKQYIICILNGAGGGGRTHNLKLGKLALCQLSYARIFLLYKAIFAL